MNYRALSDNDLADFASNVSTLLAGTELDAIDPNVRRDLQTALGTLPADMSTQTAAAAIAEAERKAAVSAKNATRKTLISLMSQVRDALRAGRAPEKQYSLCQFDYPKGPSIVQPETPTELVASGTSNGVNTLRFSGNNKSGTVVYEIWRLSGDTAPFTIIATTRKQAFEDAPVTPGQYYNYKVRAVASRARSNFSNVAVVYGAI